MAKTKSFPQQQDVTDISLSIVRKKRFRIDGDDSRIIELNTSDLNILARLKEAYPKLVTLAEEAFKNLPEVDGTAEDYNFASDEATATLVTTLTEADKKMRELIDYIFDSNVSELCAPSGSMYDPINGAFRFEHIISTLSALYEADISSEMGTIARRVKKHTDKYTG
jgi:hypothetical protein